MTRVLAFALVASFLFITGCDTVDPEPPVEVGPHLLVGNQGNFSSGDGSVSVVDLESWEVSTPIDEIESIVQSIFTYDDRVHVMSNTGRRVDVFLGGTLERHSLTTGLVSPRYGAELNDRLFVSNLYSNPETYSGGVVTVINGLTYQRIAEITVGDHPEGVAAQAGRVFVANHGFGSGSTVSVIDPATLEVVETIDADCDGPRFLVPGQGDDLYLTCTGTTLYDEEYNVIGASDGAVRVINGRSGAITARRSIDGQVSASDYGQDAFYDSQNNHLYVVVDTRTVKVLDGSTLEALRTIGPVDGASIGAVAFDAAIDRLYLARVAGFTTAGSVTVHSPDGSLERTVPVGIAPTSLVIQR